MKVTETKLKGCFLIEPDIYKDKRGFFMETFQKENFDNLVGSGFNFVQDNHSRSSYGVLRGLHFQIKKPQGKLVRVSRGKVFDVAVDLRKNSPTYGEWIGEILSEENNKQLWVPPGFAHGFLVLSENADFLYKCSTYYDPNDEGSIIWNDESIGIDWPIKDPVISEKDLQAKSLAFYE